MSRGEIAARRHARELALQALYQWLLHATNTADATDAAGGAAEARRPTAPASLVEQPPQVQLHAIEELAAPPVDDGATDNGATSHGATTGETGKKRPRRLAVDAEFFAALLQGTVAEAAELRTLFAPLLSRAVEELSPVEHAVLLLGAYELRHGIETPYRVIINEGIELAKKYGSTDGHKFVNGVLDRLAANLRAGEVAATRTGK
ncbi:MAG: transcription antitermination factor NusB [Azoarcus sp.]|jgi:transcription antitermination factor NusB|nr:transcription antitermination factor NusB [Azoarcus sp.]